MNLVRIELWDGPADGKKITLRIEESAAALGVQWEGKTLLYTRRPDGKWRYERTLAEKKIMPLAQLMQQFTGRVQYFTAPSQDAGGSWQPTWKDLFAPVYGRIEDASSARVEQYARMQLNVTHEIFTSQPGVRVGHRFVIQGRTFLVHGNIAEPATGTIPTYQHFICEEERPAIAN